MLGWRIAFISGGILLGLFGVYRLVTQVQFHLLIVLAIWLVGAVVIHDGFVAPLTVSVGWLIGRVVPARARRYVQAALIVAGMITLIAVPLILRRNSQPRVKAILLQNYGAHLVVVFGLIAGASLLLYAAQVVRDARRPVPAGDGSPGPQAPPDQVAE